MRRELNNMRDFAITTLDNMYNPFTQHEQWSAYDREKQYNTERWLAFLGNTSVYLEDDEYYEEAMYAANRLLELNPFGIHVKVYEDEASKLIPLFNKVYEENKAEYEALKVTTNADDLFKSNAN
jgi:hypothetical protein